MCACVLARVCASACASAHLHLDAGAARGQDVHVGHAAGGRAVRELSGKRFKIRADGQRDVEIPREVVEGQGAARRAHDVRVAQLLARERQRLKRRLRA